MVTPCFLENLFPLYLHFPGMMIIITMAPLTCPLPLEVGVEVVVGGVMHIPPTTMATRTTMTTMAMTTTTTAVAMTIPTTVTTTSRPHRQSGAEAAEGVRVVAPLQPEGEEGRGRPGAEERPAVSPNEAAGVQERAEGHGGPEEVRNREAAGYVVRGVAAVEV